MGILTQTEQPRGAVILLHGCGTHPDWPDVIHPLRIGLPDKGWTTLSIQLPVLDKGAKESDYIPLFNNAGKRIDAAIKLMKQKGVAHIILAGHTCGADMAISWLNRTGGSGIDAFIGTGMDKLPPMAEVGTPILDVYGEKESAQIIEAAPQRQGMIQKAGNPASKQMVLPEANHDFANKGAELTAVISSWLNTLPL